jgi:hypothetical protein
MPAIPKDRRRNPHWVRSRGVGLSLPPNEEMKEEGKGGRRWSIKTIAERRRKNPRRFQKG